jgi:hypothetical protein
MLEEEETILTASSGHPAAIQALFAFSASRSATLTTCIPATLLAWFKKAELKVPAPITPTLTGLLMARLFSRRPYRLMSLTHLNDKDFNLRLV